MTLELIFEIILGIAILAFICAVAFGNKKSKEKKKTDLEIDEYINSDGEVISTHVEVVNISCGTKLIGSKQPKSVEWYTVAFKKDNGEIIEVAVDSEMYEGLDMGMKGELTLVNGQLSSFILD